MKKITDYMRRERYVNHTEGLKRNRSRDKIMVILSVFFSLLEGQMKRTMPRSLWKKEEERRASPTIKMANADIG